MKAFHDNCHLREEKKGKRKPRFWSEDLETIKREAKRTKQRYFRYKTDERKEEMQNIIIGGRLGGSKGRVGGNLLMKLKT